MSARLQLDGLGTSFLEETAGILHGVVHRRLIGQKRQVADHHGLFRPPCDRLAVMEHIFHGDRQGIFIPQHDHAQRIAHEQRVDSRFVKQLRRGIIVGGEHGEFLLVLFGFLERCHSCFIA